MCQSLSYGIFYLCWLNSQKTPPMLFINGDFYINCMRFAAALISNGKIIWAGKWTASQIEEGRLYEVSRREAYYTNQNKNNLNIFLRFWHFLKKLTGKE